MPSLTTATADSALLGQGLWLMVYGMGTVIVFLGVLVLAVRLMSALVQRYQPQLAVAQAPERASPAAEPALAQAEVLAAVVAAVHQHRARTAQKHPPLQ